MTDSVGDLPEITVVIPTFNRRERLARVLTALAQQTTDVPFEVVVVSDGSTDGTNEYLSSGRAPLTVIVVEQSNAGPAVARNEGVLAATGRLILFLDDDVVPATDLVEQHLSTHRASSDDVVVIGPMLTPDDSVLSPWVAWEQHQLYKQYDAMERGLWECTFRQFYTGNASLPRQRVLDVGLFDPSFRRAEDVELAFRLHQAGVSFRFVREARGYHYAERTFDSWLSNAREYGRNDVAFIDSGQAWLSSTLPEEFKRRNPLIKLLTRLCVPRPRLADAVATGMRWVAASPASIGALRRQALSGLFNLAYYRGIADALGSGPRFLRFIHGRDSTTQAPVRAAFVLEQALGHVTHSINLTTLVKSNDELVASFLPVPFERNKFTIKIPGYGNWTVRAGLRARQLVRRESRQHGIDVLFVHTQVPAILLGKWMDRIPTVVSLDATPLQYDEMGDHYGHALSTPLLERWKFAANRRCFQRASHLVVWSDWTRGSLIRDYGIDSDRITVIPAGVDFSRWDTTRRVERPCLPLKILFVGGDLERKGGHLLIEAVNRLRTEDGLSNIELHLVTRAHVPRQPGVFVHDKMTPNSPELIELYQACDIFCLPTYGDCFALVLAEAASCSLTVVSTDVGAIHEFVKDDETGILIPPGDVDALTASLRRLAADPVLRERLALAAHHEALLHHDAETNAGRIVDVLLETARVNRASRAAG